MYDKIKKNENLPVIFIIILNIIFFFITFNNPWTLNDYGYFHSAKLYNLINDQMISFDPFIFKSGFGFNNEKRYMPVYYFFNQFLPISNISFHFIIVTFHTLSCICIFYIAKKIFKRNDLSLIVSVIYALNYSASIKVLSWNCFYAHILAALFGFLSLLAIIKYYEKENSKKRLIFFYLTLSTLSTLTTESGLIFPIMSFFIVIFFFSKKNFISKSLIIFSPIIIFILMVFFNTGKILPILEGRVAQDRQIDYESKFNPYKDNKVYYYRSTYAPRNFESYIVRSIDNILVSFNLTSFEKIIKFYDKSEVIKNNLKKYFYYYALFILLISILSLNQIVKKNYNFKNSKELKYSLILYLIIFLVYTIIFFRRDINLGLSFCTGLLVSFFLKDLIGKNKNIIKNIILIIFFSPAFIYSLTLFSYWGEDWGPRYQMENEAKYIKDMTANKVIIKNMKNFSDYKNYYYFYNFKDYKDILVNKYKGKTFIEFQNLISEDEIQKIN